jgi:hypothetical protein
VRGLRALAVALADVVGPSHWGLRDEADDFMDEAKKALDYIFQVSQKSSPKQTIKNTQSKVECLDAYLPLLSPPPSPEHATTTTFIAQLLASAIRSEQHRAAITNWAPPSERCKEVKGKRGWEKEKKDGGRGGWVTRSLVALLSSRNGKVGLSWCLLYDRPIDLSVAFGGRVGRLGGLVKRQS